MDIRAASGLAEIRQHDPAIDEVGLIAETRRIVATVYDAQSQGDPAVSRSVMGDAAWAEQRLRLADLQAAGRRRAVDSLTIGDVRIVDAHSDGTTDTVTAQVTYTAVERDVDARTGHGDGGPSLASLVPRHEAWVLQRPASSVTPVPGAAYVRCPSCGASVAAGAATCEYCHHPIPAGGGWRVTLVTPTAAGAGVPLLADPMGGPGLSYGEAAAVFASARRFGGCAVVGVAVAILGAVAGVVVPVVLAVHNSSSSADPGSGGSSFPDPAWKGTIHLAGGYVVKDTAFTATAGRFDLTCAQLTDASPSPDMTDAVPDIDVTLPDRTRILISTPSVDADYTGPGTYTFRATDTGSIDVDVQPQGRTKDSLLWTNENAGATATVVIRPDGSGSVTFTHLNDPFSPSTPGEFLDGGYSWTCSQSS